jgi:hypothetical protein
MSFFTPTKDEIELAKNGGREVLKFTNKEEVHCLIKEVKEKEELLIVITDILNGDKKGKEHTVFFRSTNSYSKQDAINLMLAFFSAEDLGNRKISAANMVGKKFKTYAEVSAKIVSGETREYVNFRKFTELDGVPTIESNAVDASDIPF